MIRLFQKDQCDFDPYCLFGWLFGTFVGWLVGWLFVWLNGWLVVSSPEPKADGRANSIPVTPASPPFSNNH